MGTEHPQTVTETNCHTNIYIQQQYAHKRWNVIVYIETYKYIYIVVVTMNGSLIKN